MADPVDLEQPEEQSAEDVANEESGVFLQDTLPNDASYYETIVRAWNEAPAESIAQDSRDYLIARANHPDVISSANWIRSISASDAARLFKRPVQWGGTCIQYANAPEYHRLRPHGGKDAKNICPKGIEPPIWVHPWVTQRFASDDPLYIVEGTFKATALLGLDLCTVGLGGVDTTYGGASCQLHTSWGALPLRGRQVVLVLDANIQTSPGVARAASRLTRALQKASAKVFVATLPLEANGGDKWGPDDYLVRKGEAAFRSLLHPRALRSADPVQRTKHAVNMANEEERGRRIEELSRSLFFRISLLETPGAADSVAEELGRGYAGKVKEWVKRAEQELKAYNKRKQDTLDDASQAKKMDGYTYVVQNDQLVWMRPKITQEGYIEVPEPLCNFNAQIVKDILLDDGSGIQQRFYKIAGSQNGIPLPTFTIESDIFDEKESWIGKNWGHKCEVYVKPSATALTRCAIRNLSTNAEQITTYTQTGFREINGVLVFLHAGGALGASNISGVGDSVDSEHEKLKRYRLPADSFAVDTENAIRTSLSLLACAPDRISIPLFCAMFRAPLSHWKFMDSALYVWGKTGSRKSSLVALHLAHFGVGFNDKNALPGNFASSYTALELLSFLAKDVPFVIDDYKPATTDPRDPMYTLAQQIIGFGVGNQAGRDRGKANGGLRPSLAPRCLTIVSAEQNVRGESLVARTFSIPVVEGDLDLTKMKALQMNDREREKFSYTMAAYIRFLLQRDISTWIKERFYALRDQFQTPGAHGRLAEAAANLALGGEAFARFAEIEGVFLPPDRDAFLERVYGAIKAAVEQQKAESVSQDPVAIFLEWLRSARVSGQVWVEYDPGRPEHICGRERDGSLSEPKDVPLVGWKEEEFFYLNPSEVYRCFMTAMRASGTPFPLGKEALWRALFEKGMIVAGNEKGRSTRQVKKNGERIRALMVFQQVLVDTDNDTSPKDPFA